MNRKVRSIGLVALAVVVLGGALTSCTRESKARAQEAPQVHGTVYLAVGVLDWNKHTKHLWTSLPMDKTACDPLLQAMEGATVTVHDGAAGPVLATLDVGAPTLDPQSATLPEGTQASGWGGMQVKPSRAALMHRKAACWATSPFQGPIPKSPDGRYTFFIDGVDEAKTMGNFFSRSGYRISYSDLAAQGFQLALGGGDDFEKAWQALVATRAVQGGSVQPPSGSTESAQSVSGTAHIDQDFGEPSGKKLDSPCTPNNIKKGSGVSVKDGDGNLVATGEVTSNVGVIVQEKHDWYLDCSVPFVVPDVPMTESYSFQVEGLVRTFHFSKEQMVSQVWEITLYEKS